ncbi:unnamed protein product [Pleuronectes platessa]|uniref:Leucine rich repeat containing 75B n=1 Tax=Pleuronectes platessa TaxID=8262 RepID=A0A9N7Z1G5_PLEPL|nr:unnamed protein product [Pleuronectes platessa]
MRLGRVVTDLTLTCGWSCAHGGPGRPRIWKEGSLESPSLNLIKSTFDFNPPAPPTQLQERPCLTPSHGAAPPTQTQALRREGRDPVVAGKPSDNLKTTLKKKVSGDVVNLSGIPLSGRDVHRVAFYLQSGSDAVTAVDLSFTELQDESLRLLLPHLGGLPKLTILAVNGNRLTVAILKELTDTVKDPKKFPCLAWIDLGNNVDIFTVPQPLLVALRRRFGLRSSLPTIYEYNEAEAFGRYNPNMETSVEEPSLCEEGEVEEDDREEEVDRLELRAWDFGAENVSKTVPLHFCGR